MNKLWAPWRVNYVKSISRQKGCLFCRVKKYLPAGQEGTDRLIPGREKQDKKNFVILRNPLCFAMLNLFPYNNGHLMISPYRHVKDLSDLNNEETLDLIRTTCLMKEILDGILRPQGYNIGINIGKAAGAGIAGHLHVHIVPRWQGDTNFMPVISGTKVIPQSLRELYEILRKEISSAL